jgi:hypothetical protein
MIKQSTSVNWLLLGTVVALCLAAALVMVAFEGPASVWVLLIISAVASLSSLVCGL